jgi:hypothetical protein
MKSELLDETLELLNRATENRPTIEKNTGLKADWLKSLQRGDYKDPGVVKIQTLNKYLKKKGKVFK